MVVTDLPATSLMLVWQERIALPSMWTVQAPHKPEPQPNLVPVSLRCSRTTQSSGVLASTSTFAAVPLTVNATAMAFPPRRIGPHAASRVRTKCRDRWRPGAGPPPMLVVLTHYTGLAGDRAAPRCGKMSGVARSKAAGKAAGPEMVEPAKAFLDGLFQ